MNPKIKELTEFLDSAHSVYHAVADLVWTLEAAGYTCLPESGQWDLSGGGKYYLTRGGSSVVAFRIPETNPAGFMISAAHGDRPCFKLKENPEKTGPYTRLGVEKYGGMLMHSWLDRPLSVAGRVLVATDSGVESRLLDLDRDLVMIPNVAIHMKNSNEGYTWNPAVDMLPLLGGANCAGALEDLIAEAAGGPVLGQDLFLYNRQKATVWGMEEEYLSAPALDDLVCAWCCTQGFLRAEERESIPVLCLFDSEETGSESLQGAGSDLLKRTLERICRCLHLPLDRMLSQTLLVSADNAHALHPNHPEYADENNAPLPGAGVVLKFNAAQRYTTDGVSAALWRQICSRAEVPVQTYCNRADMPGGSTLGHVSMGQVSVLSVDVGLSQLAMHSAYETVGVADVAFLERAMTCFYGSCLRCPADGSYLLS